MACQLNEVWPETLEMEGKGIGSGVDVKRLVGCLISATHNILLDLPAWERRGTSDLRQCCQLLALLIANPE